MLVVFQCIGVARSGRGCTVVFWSFSLAAPCRTRCGVFSGAFAVLYRGAAIVHYVLDQPPSGQLLSLIPRLSTPHLSLIPSLLQRAKQNASFVDAFKRSITIAYHFLFSDFLALFIQWFQIFRGDELSRFSLITLKMSLYTMSLMVILSCNSALSLLLWQSVNPHKLVVMIPWPNIWAFICSYTLFIYFLIQPQM